jgi:hypothetical protein
MGCIRFRYEAIKISLETLLIRLGYLCTNEHDLSTKYSVHVVDRSA